MEKKIEPSEQKTQALRALLQSQSESKSDEELLDVRRTNPVRRAQASIWAVAKNSVPFSSTPSYRSAITASFLS